MKKSEGKSGEGERGGRRVLVGTYRPENAAWIREKGLYNLPMGSDPMGEKTLTTRQAEAAFGAFSAVVLYSEDRPSMAFAATFREIVDGAWLKANGKKCFAFTRLDAHEIGGLKKRAQGTLV